MNYTENYTLKLRKYDIFGVGIRIRHISIFRVTVLFYKSQQHQQYNIYAAWIYFAINLTVNSFLSFIFDLKYPHLWKFF
jgi:hypothetical protein